MRKTSDNYKKYINDHFSLTPKSKIVVDGVEYLGDIIKTSPKFSHSNTAYIGGFPKKTVDFEMLNFNNDIDFKGKELIIYKGLVINNQIEWVKQGVFIPQAENIETNVNARTISFKDVSDKTQFLDDKYESNLDWSREHSGLEIVQEICNRKNLILETTDFHFANYIFKQPNFPSKITYREVLSRIAQIGGEIAIFNNNGNLEIKGQYLTRDVILRKRYAKITKENIFQPNLLVIGNEGYDNDIIYPNPKPDDPIEIRIEDNPFVDLNREEMIEIIASYVLSVSYIPFEVTNFVDGYLYELNDVIQIIDKDDNIFNAVLLDISTTSRIKSTIKAPVNSKTISKYNLAGSNKKNINEVKLAVDHINNLIESLVKNVDGNTEQITQILQNITDIVMNVQQSGGNNLIKNSVGFAGTTEWDLTYDNEETSTVNTQANVELLENGTSGGAFLLNGVKISQSIIVSPSSDYCFSCKVNKRPMGTGFVKIYNPSDENQVWLRKFEENESLNYEEIKFEGINISGNTLVVEIYGDEDSNLVVTDSMLNKGNLLSVWTQANGEILNTLVNINMNGVAVKSLQFDETGQYVTINPLEFAGYAKKNGVQTRVFTLNGDTTVVNKLRAEEEISMKPIKIVPINGTSNDGWGFVSDLGGGD